MLPEIVGSISLVKTNVPPLRAQFPRPSVGMTNQKEYADVGVRATESARAADFRGRKRVNLGDIEQRLDGDFFAFGVALAAGGAVIHSVAAEAGEHRGV